MAGDDAEGDLRERFNALETNLRQRLSNLFAKFGAKLLEAARRLDAHAEQLHDHEERITEIERVTRWIPKPRNGTGALRMEHWEEARVIMRRLNAYFNEAELVELCFDFGLDYENLKGDGKKEKAQQVVMHFYRRNTLGLLVMWLKKLRPQVQWPLTDGR